MRLTKKLEENILTVNVAGRLDTVTSRKLGEELEEVIREAEELVLDLEDLEYMSSAGLRVILATEKKMAKKGGMKVIHVNDVVREVFDITGFSDFLTIE